MIDYTVITKEIIAEIEDPLYETRTHGIKATHSAGCRGPMCRKALRDAMRERRAANGARAYQRSEDAQRLDDLLDRVILAHKENREKEKANVG